MSELHEKIFLPSCLKELDSENQKFVVDTLQEFVFEAVVKYVKGQKEHGGKLWERDCLEEAKLENIDQMWYLAGAIKNKDKI